MRASLLILPLAFLLACRGEPPPRNGQNKPPATTHPVTSSSQNSGAEGKNITRQPENPTAPTTTLKDQPPTTDSQHATQTTSTAATGTHLAAPP